MSVFLRRSALIGGLEVVFRLPLLFTAGWLARSVGTEAFGAWALILLYQTLLAIVVSQGLPTAVSRYAAASTSTDAGALACKAFRRMIIGWAIATGATALLLPVLTAALDLPDTTAWVLLPACAIGLTAMSEGLLDAFFKARELLRRQIAFLAGRTLIEISVVGSLFILGVGDAWIDTPAQWLVAYIAATTTLKALLYLTLAMPVMHRGSIDDHRWRGMIRFGLPLAASGLVSAFAGQGDRLLVSYVIPAHDLGIYAFAGMLATNMHMLGTAIYALVLPRAARAHDAGQPDEVRRLFADSQMLFLAAWVGSMAVVGLFPREIILITAGTDYISGATILALLALAWGLEQFLGIYRWLFHLVGKTGHLPYVTALQSILVLGGVAAGALMAGGLGAAFGAGAGVLAANGLQFALAMRVCPMKPSVELIVASAASLGVIAGLVSLGTAGAPLALRASIAVLVLVPCAAFALRQLGWLRTQPGLRS